MKPENKVTSELKNSKIDYDKCTGNCNTCPYFSECDGAGYMLK